MNWKKSARSKNLSKKFQEKYEWRFLYMVPLKRNYTVGT